MLSPSRPYAQKHRTTQYASRTEVDDDKQVLEYLNKKGYSKTEATLRREVADRDESGRPVARKVQDKGWEKYSESYGTVKASGDLLFMLTFASALGELRR